MARQCRRRLHRDSTAIHEICDKTMTNISLPSNDIEALALMLGERSSGSHVDKEAIAALAAVLVSSHTHSDAERWETAVLGSTITYQEANGVCHTVNVVYPIDADPSRARVSVLSPVGHALLGRRLGSESEVRSPSGARVAIRIVDLRHPAGTSEDAPRASRQRTQRPTIVLGVRDGR